MNKPISSLFVFSVVYCVVFRQKLKKTRRKHKTNRKKQKTTEKLREKQQQNRNTGYPAHEPPRINISYLFAEVRGLDILYFCFVLCFSRSFSVLFLFLYVCLCFRLVYLSFCIYNRKNTYKNITKTKKLREKHKNIKTNNRNTLFPSRNLRDIYSRSGRGLDILYFCFVLCFSRSFSVYVCFFMFVFMFSPSLFKLLHLQSNKHI